MNFSKLLKILIFSYSVFLNFGDAVATNIVDKNDRHPQADDVIVPMPCGINMVFRKVYTSYNDTSNSESSFEDGLNEDETKTPASEGPFRCTVKGAFTDEKGRYMLIAKYELMEYQYKALKTYKAKGICPASKASNKDRMPKVNITYFEAQELAELYSAFLEKSENTPLVEGQKKAIARLTSGCAWSFAARGGLLVNNKEREGWRPPELNNLNDYVWYSSPQSSNNRLQVTGLKRPSVLGIYDMFGNAKEMMAERFRARKNGQEIGEEGGIVVRGGSFLTNMEHIYSARRSENENKPARDTGFRLMLSSPSVYTSTTVFKEINEDAIKKESISNKSAITTVLIVSSVVSSIVVLLIIAFLLSRKKKHSTVEDNEQEKLVKEHTESESSKENNLKNSNSFISDSKKNVIQQVLDVEQTAATKTTIKESTKIQPKIEMPSSCFRGSNFKLKFSLLPIDSTVNLETQDGISALPSNIVKADKDGNALIIIGVSNLYRKDILTKLKAEITVLDVVVATIFTKQVAIKDKPAVKAQNDCHLSDTETITKNKDEDSKSINNQPESNVEYENKTPAYNQRTVYMPATKAELIKLVRDNSISLSDIDISRIDDLSKLFAGAPRTDYSGISSWNMSHVKSTSFMFFNQTEFNENISEWNLNSLQKADHMFYGAKSFDCNLHKWKLPSSVDKTDMFKGTLMENRPPVWY